MATNATTPKPFVFVLMPFAPDFDDVYKIGIKEACKKAGAYCERLDDQIFEENMLEHIYNQIAKADLIIADMTGRNPNVFYEVGYAHALGKTVILLTKDGSDIPFDLKHHYHLVYKDSITTLRDDLQKRVRYYVKHPNTASSDEIFDLDLYINDQSVNGFPTIDVRVHERSYVPYSDYKYPQRNVTQQFLPVRLTVHHRQKISFEDVYIGVQLITPGVFSKCVLIEPGSTTIYNSVRMPGNSIAHRPLSRMNVSPGEWEAVDFPLCTDSDSVEAPCSHLIDLHLLRSGPPLVFPFTINVLPTLPVSTAKL